ncbi:TetR/AcrR family transcriptional regulator [Actinophytocola sp.]|uniref:TetR/AcrR family transcriptional regulator n=1 Tax=Actinophytocola sp. TaxID=1872138 RepID=UPI002ED1B79E
MPRTADHDLRRGQVSDALLRVIARAGFAEASMAAIAAEAGVSVGLIQRYFSTKDELLEFAFGCLTDRTFQRLDTAWGERREGEDIADTVYRMLETMLPLDEERFAEALVWVAFLAGTLPAHPALSLHAAAMRQMHEALGAETSHVEAVLLTSVVDGLILDMVTNPADVTPELATRGLRLAVDRVFR